MNNNLKIVTLISGIFTFVFALVVFIIYQQYWSPQKEAEAMLREAILIAERGSQEATNQSLQILTSLWARYQDLPIANKALLHIGQNYEKIGLNESALEKYRYLKQNPRGLSDHDMKVLDYRIAHIQILQNYSGEAYVQLYQLLQQDLDKKFRSQIYTELGMLYAKQGDYRKAVGALEIAEKENGSNLHATLEKAKVLRLLGKHDQVFGIYQKFLSYDTTGSSQSKDVMYMFRSQAFQRGQEEYRANQYWAAIKYFDMVVQRFPGSVESVKSLYYTGESYFGLGLFQKAIFHYQRVRESGNADLADDSLYKIAESYYQLEKYEMAAQFFGELLNKFPNSSYASLAREWKQQSENEILHRTAPPSLPESDANRGGRNNSEQDRQTDADVFPQMPQQNNVRHLTWPDSLPENYGTNHNQNQNVPIPEGQKQSSQGTFTEL